MAVQRERRRHGQAAPIMKSTTQFVPLATCGVYPARAARAGELPEWLEMRELAEQVGIAAGRAQG